MRTTCLEPIGLLIVCATDSLALESWAMENAVEKTMHFEPEGVSPGSATSGLCDLWASVLSVSGKDREWS